MADKTLVVRGGKLIDGTGRAPIENSVIVIQSGRFQAVGKSGEVAIPAGAEMIVTFPSTARSRRATKLSRAISLARPCADLPD